jgi:hypothetical protein
MYFIFLAVRFFNATVNAVPNIFPLTLNEIEY